MKNPLRLLKVAAWCILLFGIIHEATFIYSYVTLPETEPVVGAMKAFPIAGTPTHLYSFYNGYALLMGVLLMSLGIFYLVVIGAAGEALLRSGGFMGFNLLVSALALGISTVYFSFAVPIVLTGLALACFAGAFALRGRAA